MILSKESLIMLIRKACMENSKTSEGVAATALSCRTSSMPGNYLFFPFIGRNKSHPSSHANRPGARRELLCVAQRAGVRARTAVKRGIPAMQWLGQSIDKTTSLVPCYIKTCTLEHLSRHCECEARSNPDTERGSVVGPIAYQSGLPRRCAPRNDGLYSFR